MQSFEWQQITQKAQKSMYTHLRGSPGGTGWLRAHLSRKQSNGEMMPRAPSHKILRNFLGQNLLAGMDGCRSFLLPGCALHFLHAQLLRFKLFECGDCILSILDSSLPITALSKLMS